MFDKNYYEEKLNKLKAKNQQILQDYINTGIKFGQDIADLNAEFKEVQQLIDENTKKNDTKISKVKA
jgi:peptidoglycan hydrolase CwlO-like protein